MGLARCNACFFRSSDEAAGDLPAAKPHELVEEHVELADLLVRLSPPELDRVFFVNSGSEAIDTAIKAEQAGMMRQAGSPENIEAVTAFMERRAPDFSKL